MKYVEELARNGEPPKSPHLVFAIINLVKSADEPVVLSASGLLEALNAIVPEDIKAGQHWPQSPTDMACSFKYTTCALAAYGIHIQQVQISKRPRKKQYRLTPGFTPEQITALRAQGKAQHAAAIERHQQRLANRLNPPPSKHYKTKKGASQ